MPAKSTLADAYLLQLCETLAVVACDLLAAEQALPSSELRGLSDIRGYRAEIERLKRRVFKTATDIEQERVEPSPTNAKGHVITRRVQV